MESQIVRFVKRGKKTVGCVIARKVAGIDNKVFVSGSLCRKGKDVFSKENAVNLAEDRAIAMAYDNRPCALPHSLKSDIAQMAERAHRYFKEMDVVYPPIHTVTGGIDKDWLDNEKAN